MTGESLLGMGLLYLSLMMIIVRDGVYVPIGCILLPDVFLIAEVEHTRVLVPQHHLHLS